MANSEKAFLTEATLRARVMMDSISRYMEMSMLYGKGSTGIGTLYSATPASTTCTCVIPEAQWADGVWGSAVGMVVEFYRGTTQIADTTNVTGVVASVVASTRTVVFTCASATLSTAIQTAVASYTVAIYPKGAYSNDMIGLDAQITGGASYLGIDPTIYPMWQGQTYACGSASLTMAKVLAGAGLAVGLGGLNSKAVLMVSAATYQNLNADQAALRMYDSSFSGKEAENGSRGITYFGPNGEIEVVVNNMVKRGESWLLPVKYLSRVGAKEISFQRPGKTDEFFQEIPSYAGYSLRCGCEFAVLLSRPAQAVKFTGIVNS